MWLFILEYFHFSQFPMRQHWQNTVSHPEFHISLPLLHLDHTNPYTGWHWKDDKVDINGYWNIFGCRDTSINGIEGSEAVEGVDRGHGARSCRGICTLVVRWKETMVNAWWIVGRDYMVLATAEDIIKPSVSHIEKGLIITNTPVSTHWVFART